MKGEPLEFFNDSSDTSNTTEYEYIDKILMSTERNKILFDWSPLAIIIISNKGIFLDANRKLYDWLGYRPDEIIGKSLTRVPFLPDKSKETIVQNFHKRMSGEKIPPYEVELTHKNGMKKYGEIHGNLLSDEARGVTMDIIMVSDITKKKKAFKNLNNDEEIYQSIFENSDELIQIVDANGMFVDVNPAWLNKLKYSKEEINTLELKNILHENQIEDFLGFFNRAIQGENIENIETVFISKTGKEIILKGSINGFFKDGEFITTLGIFRDNLK